MTSATPLGSFRMDVQQRKDQQYEKNIGTSHHPNLLGRRQGLEISLILWPIIYSVTPVQRNSSKISEHPGSVELPDWWTHWCTCRVMHPDARGREHGSSVLPSSPHRMCILYNKTVIIEYSSLSWVLSHPSKLNLMGLWHLSYLLPVSQKCGCPGDPPPAAGISRKSSLVEHWVLNLWGPCSFPLVSIRTGLLYL